MTDEDQRLGRETAGGGVEVDLDDEAAEIVENDDGSAEIDLGADEEADEALVEEHFANLVETLSAKTLDETATTLLQLVEADIDARKERDERYAEGLRRTGLAPQDEGGPFEGSADVVHPVLVKAVIDFQAATVKELFPPSGPVKDKIIGAPNQQKVEKARRKARWLNYQITEQMREFRPDFEEALSQTGLAGASYLKFYWDQRLERPRCEPNYIDDVFYPATASSFASAPRKTHRQRVPADEMARRVASGMYAAVDGVEVPADPEASASGEEVRRIHGVEDSAENIDGVRTLFEVYCFLALERDEPDPYVVTLDDSSRRIIAVYRNWEPDDEHRQAMEHIVELPFIPWRGGFVGFVNLIGSLSKAASGALNALLDAAHVNNMPTGLRLKGVHGQTLEPSPGEIVEVDGGNLVDDIRKLFMPLPFNPPSPTLFQLLGFLSQSAESTVQTAMEKLADNNANAPVGTTLALIEQGMKVFSGIHARLHWAMSDCLRIIHRLNKHYLSTEDVKDATGEILAARRDFMGPMDVVPVSDPTIFSEAQRMMQIQAVMQRADLKPAVYNQREVEAEFLDRIRLGEFKDRFLNPVPKAEHLNAINENVAASFGKPVAALPEQDQLAHIICHMEFLMSPVFGMNPLVGQKAAPILLNHLREHFALYYLQRAYNRIAEAAGVAPEALIDVKDEELTQAFDQLASSVSSLVVAGAAGDLQQFLPDIAQVQQFASRFQPQAINPMQVEQQKVAVAQQDVQQRGQAQMMSAQARLQEAQARQAEAARRAQIEAARLAQREQEAALREQNRRDIALAQNASRAAINQADNDTAKQLAYAEMATGEKVAVSTGTGLNPQPR